MVDGGVQRNTVEDGGAKEVAVFVAGHHQAASIEDDVGASGFGVVDESGDAFLRGGVNDGAHVDALVHAVADVDFFGVCLDALGEVGADPSDGDDDGQGHAAFACGTECGGADVSGGEVKVSVGQDDSVVVGSAEGLDALAVGDAGVLNNVGNGGGAHEGDGVNAGVGEDVTDEFTVAGDDVEDAVGQAGFLVELGGEDRGRGRGGCGLEDESVAGGNGNGVHPHGHHCGEVKGADTCNNTDRLVQGVDVYPACNVKGVLALEGDIDGGGDGGCGCRRRLHCRRSARP